MSPSGHTPSSFSNAIEEVRRIHYRPEFLVEEAPAPSRLAPFAFAQTLEIDVDGEEVGSGRLVILHDPDGRESWEGDTRVIAYVDSEVERDLAVDPLLTEVGWDWLIEGIEDTSATLRALGGTVTQVNSRSFGVLDDRGLDGRIQVRASWTALDHAELVTHTHAWALLAAACSGLAPDDVGISTLPRR